MLRLALLLSLVAGQANALSCVTPDPFAAFDRAAAAEEAYIVAHGRFLFDEAVLPGMNGSDASVEVAFSGTGLTRDGFVAPIDGPVTLHITCAGAWCGGLTPGRETLVFLEQRDDGLHLAVTACPTAAFDLPDAATLDAIAGCLSHGSCRA